MYSGIYATVCYIYVYFSNPGGIFYDPVTQSDKGRLWWAQWKNYFFFSLILAFYQAHVQSTQILLPTYRVPQWGWVMIFREKNRLKRSNDSNSETKTDIVMGPTIKILATYRATNAPFTKYWITFKQKFRFWSKFAVLDMGEQSQFLL